MRILFLSSVYPQAGDPTRGVYCFNLLSALGDEHEARVVCPRAWASRLRHALGRKDPGTLAASPPVLYRTFYYPPALLKNARGWLMWASARGAVGQFLNGGFRPDCVLSYWTYPDGEAALRAGKALGVPVALIVGGSDVLLLARQPKYLRRRFLHVLRSVDEVLTVSNDLREKVLELGCRPERVHVAFQGVDTTLFSPGDPSEARRRLGLPTDRPMLLWVGRMVPVKALEVLLQACAELSSAGVRLQLCLVGDGPLRRSIEGLASDLKLVGSVTFAGLRPQRELPDWYRACDLVVLPSRSEGIPNILREAQACGRPFVASRIGGIPEIADPQTSRLVPPGSPTALAEGIRDLLTRPPAPEAVVAAARSASWEEAARRLVERLKAMIEASSPKVLVE